MMLTQRLLAVFIIVIPGIMAGYGWELMRNAIFDNLSTANEAFPLLPFIGGLILFVLGISFIGGFYVYRDKKKNQIIVRQDKNPEK